MVELGPTPANGLRASVIQSAIIEAIALLALSSER